MDPQFRQRLAGRETEVLDDEVPFGRPRQSFDLARGRRRRLLRRRRLPVDGRRSRAARVDGQQRQR
jgi:hypothetical protein